MDYKEFNPFRFADFPSLPRSFKVDFWDDSVGVAIEDAANRVFSVYADALRQFKSETAYLLSYDTYRFLDERVRYEPDQDLKSLVHNLPW